MFYAKVAWIFALVCVYIYSKFISNCGWLPIIPEVDHNFVIYIEHSTIEYLDSLFNYIIIFYLSYGQKISHFGLAQNLFRK